MRVLSKIHLVFIFSLLTNFNFVNAQHISDFESLNTSSSLDPRGNDTLKLPHTHTFQVLMQAGDYSTIPKFNSDFTGYVPINNSSENGYLSINNEFKVGSDCNTNIASGGVLVLDIEFDNDFDIWNVLKGTNINFDAFEGTSKNCSGAVTPWGTIISSEEHGNSSLECQAYHSNGYYRYGWQVEIDPVNKQVLGKHYAMGRFKHENAAIHPNQRTVYQGADDEDGYLYKFVAYSAGDLSAGDLYVYKDDDDASKFVQNFKIKSAGKGKWIRIANNSINERNRTKEFAKAVGATKFNKLEDVEIGPNGIVYFAVADEGAIYRLEDLDPIPNDPNQPGIVNFLGYYFGVYGNDNLAFDNEGNLWVAQDGDDYLIWMVENGHTQSRPKVKIFAITPENSEPTGITFSPDNRFMFLSLQLNNGFNNSSVQLDADYKPIRFNRATTMVIARREYMGNQGCAENLLITKGSSSFNTQTYQAQESISSSASFWFENANYYAGQSIELLNGFEIGTRSNFLADIKYCE